MTGFIFRRFVQAIIVILGVILIVFILSQLIPGGECKAVNGPKATVTFCRHWNILNGYSQPLWVQFWHYIIGLPHLNLGYSYKRTQPVEAVIAEYLPKTLVLVGTATVIALIIAIPLGILQVVKRNTPADYGLTALSFIFYAMPPFLLGTLLIIFFSFDHHLLPSQPPSDASAWAVFTDPRAFIMPDDHAVRHHHRLIQSLHALVHDGRHGRGLHPHGAGQGRQPTAWSSTGTPCATPSSPSSP